VPSSLGKYKNGVETDDGFGVGFVFGLELEWDSCRRISEDILCKIQLPISGLIVQA
jgi:hypothetical protein